MANLHRSLRLLLLAHVRLTIAAALGAAVAWLLPVGWGVLQRGLAFELATVVPGLAQLGGPLRHLP